MALPAYSDLIDEITSQNVDPDVAAAALRGWRDEARQQTALEITDTTERWKAVDAMDERVAEDLGAQRQRAAQLWLTERIPDPAEQQNFIRVYDQARGDPKAMQPEIAALSEEYNALANDPIFNSPHEDRMATGKISVGQTPLARYTTRTAGDQTEVLVQPDREASATTPLGAPSPAILDWEQQDQSPISFSIPTPRPEDLEGAAAEAEARARQLDARKTEILMNPEDRTPTQPLDNDIRDLQEKAAGYRSPNGQRLLADERIRQKLKDQYSGSIGNAGPSAWTGDLVKGLGDAVFQAGSSVGRPFLSEQKLRTLAEAQEQLDTAIPGSTRNAFEGGVLNEASTAARRSFGQMLPYMTGAGALRASGAVAEGISQGTMTTTGGAFVGGAGSSYQETDRAIAAAEQTGDSEEAQRLRGVQNAHALLTGLSEAFTERISPLEGMKVRSGVARTTVDILKEGIEEPTTGFIQRGLIDPALLDRHADVFAEMPVEFIAGIGSAGGMAAVAKAVERVIPKHEQKIAEIDAQHTAAVELAKGLGVTDDDTQAALVLASEGQKIELAKQTAAETAREIALEVNSDPSKPPIMWEKAEDGQQLNFRWDGQQWNIRASDGTVSPATPEQAARLEARSAKLKELQVELDEINAKEHPSDDNNREVPVQPVPTEAEMKRQGEIIQEKGRILFGEVTPEFPAEVITPDSQTAPTPVETPVNMEEEVVVRQADPVAVGEVIPPRPTDGDPAVVSETLNESIQPQSSDSPQATTGSQNATEEVIPPNATAIKHAQIDSERAAMGLEPIMKQAGREFGPMIEQAAAVIAARPATVPSLVASIIANPRSHTAEEGAQMLVQKENLERQRAAAAKIVNDPASTPEQQAQAAFEMEQATMALTDLHLAASYSGSETGRGLAFRKYLVPRDEIPPLEVMLAERTKIKRDAAKGTDRDSELTPQERAEVESTHREMIDLKQRADALDAEVEQAGLEKTVEDLADEVRGEQPADSRAEQAKALRDRIQQAREKIRQNQQARAEPPLQASAARLADEKVNAREMRRYGLPDAPTTPKQANRLVRDALAKVSQDMRLPPPLRLMARELSKLNFPGLFLQVLSDGRLNLAGQYQPGVGGQGILTINLRQIGLGNEKAEQNIAETLVHEALHHATYRNYRNPQNEVQKDAVKEINGLLGHIRSEMKRLYGNRFEYQTSTVDELISAIYTQREFQDALAGLKAKRGLGGKIKNALAEIFRALTRLVVGHEVSPDSALAQAYDYSMRLIGQQGVGGAGQAAGLALQSPAQQEIHPDDLPLYQEAAKAYGELNGETAASEMARDFPELSAQTITELLAQNRTTPADRKVSTKPKGKKKGKTTAQVKSEAKGTLDPALEIPHKLARDLAKARIEEGVKDVADLMERVRQDLTELSGAEVTTAQVRQAITNYGKTFKLERTQADRQLADYRTQMRLMESLERAMAKLAPLRTGPQREKASEEVRSLKRQLDEYLAKTGYRAPDPKSLKGKLDIIQETIRNQIESLQAQLDEREPIPAGRMREEYDDETKNLQARRNALRDELRAIPANKQVLDAQDNARAAQAADLMRKEYERRVAEKEFEYSQKPDRQASAELIRARQERDAAAELWRSLRDTSPEGQQRAADREMQALIRRLEAAEAELRDEVGPEVPGRKPLDTPAAKLARERIAEVRKEIHDKAYGDGMEALRDWYTKRKAKLEDYLKNGRPEPGEGRAKPTTDEAKAMRQEIKDLDAKLREQERPARALEAVQARVKKTQETVDKLRAGAYEVARKEAKPPVDTPEIRQAQEALEQLKAIERDLHRADGTLDNDLYQKTTEAKIARLEDKIRRGDFIPQKRTEKQIKMTAESEALKNRLETVQAKYNEGVIAAKIAAQGKIKRALTGTQEALNTMRAIMTSVDFSAVLRQGGFVVLSHPVRSAASLAPMFKAFTSSDASLSTMREIDNRANADFYRKAKLFFAREGTSLQQMEEAFMSRWVGKIPKVLGGGIIRGSERAYRTFLNKLRADSFDAAIAGLSISGAPTDAEILALGNYINMATGRGDLGRFQMAATGLNTVFFAPRYVVSRFQMALGVPIFKSPTPRLKKYVVGEYARYLAGVGVVYTLGRMAMAAFGKDDDEIEWDPRSGNFGKIKFGNSYLDPLSGLGQAVVFLSRTATGQTAGPKGARAIRTSKPKFGETTWWDVMTRFVRTKLAPVPGAVVDTLSGTDLMGEPTSISNEALDLAIPISVSDMRKVIEENGVPGGIALWLASAFGFGLQVQEPRKKKAAAGTSPVLPPP